MVVIPRGGNEELNKWQRKCRGVLKVLLRCEPSDLAMLYQHEMMGRGWVVDRDFSVEQQRGAGSLYVCSGRRDCP